MFKSFLTKFRCVTLVNLPAVFPFIGETGDAIVPSVDPNGVLYTRDIIYNNLGVPTSNSVSAPPVDGKLNSAVSTLDSVVFLNAFNGVSWDRVRSQLDTSDNVAPTAVGSLGVHSRNAAYNDAGGWDRIRNNTNMEVFPPGAYTFGLTSAYLPNYNARGLHLVINMTAVPGGGRFVTPTIFAVDFVSFVEYPILIGPPISTTGFTVLKIYPGIVPVANLSASDALPRVFKVNTVNSAAGSFTYSIGAALIL